MEAPRPGLRERLADLRRRADDDFAAPPAQHTRGRHELRIEELGLKVVVTRSRYPNREGGADLYAVTLSRLAMDHRPADPEVHEVLHAAFGEVAGGATERSGGPLVRLFRVSAARPAQSPEGETCSPAPGAP